LRTGTFQTGVLRALGNCGGGAVAAL